MVNLRLRLHKILVKQESVYASLCPEFGVASQGDTKKEATDNLRSAMDALFAVAKPAEIKRRLTEDITEMLAEWDVIALKDQIDQSRQQVIMDSSIWVAKEFIYEWQFAQIKAERLIPAEEQTGGYE